MSECKCKRYCIAGDGRDETIVCTECLTPPPLSEQVIALNEHAALKVNYGVVTSQARMGHERHMKRIEENATLKRDNEALLHGRDRWHRRWGIAFDILDTTQRRQYDEEEKQE